MSTPSAPEPVGPAVLRRARLGRRVFFVALTASGYFDVFDDNGFDPEPLESRTEVTASCGPSGG